MGETPASSRMGPQQAAQAAPGELAVVEAPAVGVARDRFSVARDGNGMVAACVSARCLMQVERQRASLVAA